MGAEIYDAVKTVSIIKCYELNLQGILIGSQRVEPFYTDLRTKVYGMNVHRLFPISVPYGAIHILRIYYETGPG